MAPHESARDVVDGYLDPRNREEIAAGCTLATLTGDVARAGRGVRAGYSSLVRDLAEEFERHVGDGLPDRRGRALAALALCFAGVAIGRAVGDEVLATELMTACRTRALRELSGPGAKGAGASRRRAARGRRRG
jgi:TetR/AcrR family transcriptional repressor of nem operon